MTLFALNCALVGAVVSHYAILRWLLVRRNQSLMFLQAAIGLLVLAPLLVYGYSSLGAGRMKADLGVSAPRDFGGPPAPVQVEAQSFGVPKPAVPAPQAEIDYPLVVATTWFAASGLIVLVGFYRRWALGRWLRKWPVTGRLGNADVYSAPVPAPFCGGLLRPFIVLPEDFERLPADEREAALLHEQAHLENGHPWQGFFGEIASAFFFWLASVYCLRVWMAELQERECDEAVVRQLGEGKSLARSIVTFAERIAGSRPPQPSFSILRSRTSLEARVRHLLASKEIPMKPRKSPFIILASGLVMTVIASTVQVAPPVDTAQYMPFKTGSRWVYRVGNGDKSYEVTRIAHTMKSAKPSPVMEFTSTMGKTLSYSYMMSTPEGLRPVESTSMGGREPGFERTPLAPYLPSGAREHFEWEWKEAYRGQIMSEYGKEAKWPDPYEMRGRVVSMDQVVTVPAGTYHAIVISIRRTGAPWTKTEKTYWVKNVGRVKVEHFDKGGRLTNTEELLSYKPAP